MLSAWCSQTAPINLVSVEMTLETVLFWKKKHNITHSWFGDSVFFSSLDVSVQSCISREFWSSMLVMIVELMWWGRKSRTLLLLLLVLHGKCKLIKIRKLFNSIRFLYSLQVFLLWWTSVVIPAHLTRLLYLMKQIQWQKMPRYIVTPHSSICNKCFKPNTYVKLMFYIHL